MACEIGFISCITKWQIALFYVTRYCNLANAAFTHVCLTTRYWTKSLYKSTFVLLRFRDLSFMKRIKALKLQAWNFSFKTWKSVFANVRYHSWSLQRLTVECKRSINFIVLIDFVFFKLIFILIWYWCITWCSFNRIVIYITIIYVLLGLHDLILKWY